MSIGARKSAAAIWIFVASATVAGCSSANIGGVTPQAARTYAFRGVSSSYLPVSTSVGVRSLELNRRMQSDANTQLFYVSRSVSSIFNGYKLPNKTAFCTNTPVQNTIVNSIAATADGTVWLPTQGPIFAIFSYAPNCGSQGNMLTVPANAQPVGVAFGSNGTAYGLMSYASNGTTYATVEIYPKGILSPKAEFTDPRLKGSHNYTVDGIGVDATNKVYVSCCGSPNPFIMIFDGKRSHTKGRQLFLKGLTFAAGSISFDKSGNMLVPDLTKSVLAVFAPPYTGSPKTYPLKGQPWQCGLNPTETLVACANVAANTGDIYSYPSMTYKYSVAPQGYGSLMVNGVAFAPSH